MYVLLRQPHGLDVSVRPTALWETSPWERLQLEASQNTANTCQEEQGVYLLHPHTFHFTRLPLLSHSVAPAAANSRGRGGGGFWIHASH